MTATEFDRVTSPTYLSDIATLPVGDLRSMREECQMLENSASFVRRFVQGRLDMVAAERSRRSGASDPLVADEGDAAELAGNPRPPQGMMPTDMPEALMAQLDDIIATDDLVRLGDVEGDTIDRAFRELMAFEQQVSNDRRKLHEVIDGIQAEIVRRYQSGEATVEGLLNG